MRVSSRPPFSKGVITFAMPYAKTEKRNLLGHQVLR